MTPPAVPPLDDCAAMAVFADLLSAQGDPRGELVALHLERERRPLDSRLARAESAHIARHDRALLGGLRTATSLCQLTWRRGYIVQAQLCSYAQDLGGDQLAGRRLVTEPRRPRLARLVRELLALESAQQLEVLTIQLPYSSFARAHLLACANEVSLSRPAALRMLGVYLLEQRYDDWYASDWTVAASVSEDLGDLHVSVDAGLAAGVLTLLRS